MVRLLLITIAMFFSFQAYGAECGLFKVVKGKVTYQKKNKKKFRKARVNKKVCAGDKIKTAKASRTKIVMADGNELNVSPNTEMLIEQYERNTAKNEQKVLINVLYGKIRSNVKNKYKDNKNNHYRVKTKSAVAGVRGTEFMASFNNATNQSRIVTFEGKVAVGKMQGGRFVAQVTVNPGQFTSNSPGLAPHPAKEMPPQEFASLDQETNVGSGPSGDKAPASQPAADPSGDKAENDDRGDNSQDRGDNGEGKKQPKKNQPKKEPKKGADNKGPESDGQAGVSGPEAGSPGIEGPDGELGPGPEGGPAPDQFGDAGSNPPPEFGEPSRDPASAPSIGDMDGLLPPPELPDDFANIDGGVKMPRFNDIRDIDMTNKLPDQCLQCNDAIQNRKVKLTIIPCVNGTCPGQ